MKIVSWNINGIRAITGQNPKKKYDKIIRENQLHKYIYSEKPDIICLQETKAEPSQLDEDKRAPEGYEAYFSSCRIRKGYSGVVTYSKVKADSVKDGFGIEKFDNEGRFIETDFGDFVLMNVYFPNGTSGQARVDYKLDFYDALFNYCEKPREKGRKLIICGDYNTAHKAIDLARPKANEKTSGFLPEEREKLDWIVNMGYIDTFREFNSEGGNYTWWSNRGRARENNVGWRIDYHFITKDLAPKLKNAIIQPDQEGSDHCPLVLDIDL